MSNFQLEGLEYSDVSLALNYIQFASHGLVTANQLYDKQLEGRNTV
jgi:hypothetical protein